ncbi:MAG: phospho-N-acetylmuramoyl-pentapeptide-transferase [Ruminococcaceae bacterium]|nr:phospho-N-acetylmuramoyl-pentapeptide-transferase [Oscillospiraceae bacterium]
MIFVENMLWAFGAAAAAFIISALLGKFLIPFLHKLKFGQTILEIGPDWHKKKQGTPTMGGIMFIIAIIVSTVAFYVAKIATTDASAGFTTQQSKIIIGLIMALGYGIIGFVDDYIKVVKKRNLGLTAKQKLVMQFAVAILYLAAMGFVDDSFTTTIIPFAGAVDLGWFYYVVSALVIVGIVNAANLTDGIDGLDGSITFFAAIIMMLISTMLKNIGGVIESAALAGGCLGFLVWNFHPAKVFMGDTGSLFLGGMVCSIMFALNVPILLLLIGFVYLMEMFSVMLQVSYFKLTHGKRLFKMSPIHHHFEMCGWSEVKIVCVFSLLTVILGAIAAVLVYFGVVNLA